ncbi:hypothetical protein [Photobacterium nomapromontoriensis]|uniref:hypothetical protein n=1 Tax=Photobacterium nomapromontoriensis TaxID=2910237 RepID=UPI003D0C962A
MEIKLHTNASTTPRTRKYIQSSEKSDAELAAELSISIDTVKRWRNRDSCHDKSHRPKVIHKTLSPEQEALILFLRKRLNLSLDELLEVTRLLINKGISRSSLNRCLSAYNAGRAIKPKLDIDKGQVIIDAFPLPLTIASNKSILLIFIEKFSSHISFALVKEADESAEENIADFVSNVLPYAITSVLTLGHPLALNIAHRISQQVEIHDGIDIGVDAAFDKDITDILAGELFDKRLGLGATILEYEDTLNKRIIRKRLKNLTPHTFIKQNY